jgi:tetratricopeptide (TPR) repeat protein
MNFPPGYNPSMLNNLDMNQMKMASDMISGMSDDQLRDYAKMMGMPHMDPAMFRQSAGMMKNMDQGQFNNMKNTAKNFPYAGAGASTPSSTSSSHDTKPQSSGTEATTPSKYSHIEKLKTKGNDFFKKGIYDEAASAYLEAVIEIEELRSKNKKMHDEDLDNLEVSCRLNYANVKSKEGDYEVVLAQSRAVLNIKENGKAYFRLGQALYHFKKYDEALSKLEKAISMLPGDDTVVELYEKVKKVQKASESSKAEVKATQKEGKEEERGSSVDEKRNKENIYKSGTEEDKGQSEKNEEKKSKMKKKKAPEVGVPIQKDEKKTRSTEPVFDFMAEKTTSNSKPEVFIEEEKIPESKPTTYQESYKPTYPTNITEEKLKKGQEELGNMKPEQLKMMTDYFKTMDNASLKSMLRGQTGMDISDAQLEQMKSMMTPEMLQTFSKMDMSKMPQRPNFPTQTSTTDSTTSESTIPSASNSFPGFPTGGPNMDLKSDQIQGILDMAIKNPEMLKNMVGMLGENNPMGKMLKNKSPEDLAKYMRVVQKLLKVYSKMSPVISFVKKYWQIMAGALLGYMIYRFVN